MSRNLIVVSWVSKGHDPFYGQRKTRGPSLELLTNEHSPFFEKVKKAYFLVRRDDPEGDRPSSEEIFNQLSAELRKEDPGLLIEQRLWETSASPTNYEPILEFTADQLRTLRTAHPTAKFVVNVSPGTPQMQTVMLLALQAGLAGTNVHAVQGIPERYRKDPTRVLEDVPVDLISRLNRRWVEFSGRADSPGGLWTLASAKSPGLKRAARLVEQYGAMPFPVLVLGPRGSGKSTIAAELRHRFFSDRGHSVPSHRLVRANCATFVDDALARSELFGHEKGAFTGAVGDHRGVLSQGADDCVFLDEVHHLSRSVQAMLLQALEHRGSFRPLGAKDDQLASFRLICASNRRRTELRKELYEDFYDRIATYEIELPALRDCPEDLPGLWERAVWEVTSDFIARTGPGHADPHMLFDAIRAHADRIVAVLRDHPLSANWRDLHRLARQLIAAGANGRLGSTFSLSKEAVAQAMTTFGELESNGGDHGLAAELPSGERCLEAARNALALDNVLSFEALTQLWSERLLDAGRAATRTQADAARLLGLKVKTYGDKLKRTSADRKR